MQRAQLALMSLFKEIKRKKGSLPVFVLYSHVKATICVAPAPYNSTAIPKYAASKCGGTKRSSTTKPGVKHGLIHALRIEFVIR